MPGCINSVGTLLSLRDIFPDREITLAQGSLTCCKKDPRNSDTVGNKTFRPSEAIFPTETLNFQLSTKKFSILNSPVSIQKKSFYLLI